MEKNVIITNGLIELIENLKQGFGDSNTLTEVFSDLSHTYVCGIANYEKIVNDPNVPEYVQDFMIQHFGHSDQNVSNFAYNMAEIQKMIGAMMTEVAVRYNQDGL